MASSSSSTLILSLKAVIISTGVLSIGILLKISIPHLMEFAIYEVPLIYSSLISWLQPPYLYFLINAIIITIAASSRFHTSKQLDADLSDPFIPSKSPPPPSDLPLEFSTPPVFEKIEAPATLDVIAPLQMPVEVEEESSEFVISRSTWTPAARNESPVTKYRTPEKEKPLVSSRFSHRKPVKASPEGGGRGLRVTKPKKQETLENTWKTITDGRHVPLTRHLRKSETFDNQGGILPSVAVDSPPPPHHNVSKSDTFTDRTNFDPAAEIETVAVSSGRGGGRLKKEASLSQDELNRRVEAFINKFNEEMRLQRQESLNQYMEMVSRGARH